MIFIIISKYVKQQHLRNNSHLNKELWIIILLVRSGWKCFYEFLRQLLDAVHAVRCRSHTTPTINTVCSVLSQSATETARDVNKTC